MDYNSIAVDLARSDCEGSIAVDGTANMLWNDNEKDRDVGSECEEDEGTDCEDGDSDTDCLEGCHRLQSSCIQVNMVSIAILYSCKYGTMKCRVRKIF
jgi:hypothetical protein